MTESKTQLLLTASKCLKPGGTLLASKFITDKSIENTEKELKNTLKFSEVKIFRNTDWNTKIIQATVKPKFLGIHTKNIWKRVSAPEKITLKGKELNLTAIVVHTGGANYVANFKCENEWFWYDDRPESSRHIIKHIGSYNKMLKTNPNPLSHGTLFFYS